MTEFILVAGIPGSGKTSVAAKLAESLEAVLIDRDTAIGPILDLLLAHAGAPAGAFDHPVAAHLRDATYQATLNLAVDNHALGNTVVVVAPFTREIHDPDWFAQLTDEIGHSPLLVWIDTPTDIAWDRRINRGTPRDRHLTSLTNPRTEQTTPPTVRHLRIDGTRPIHDTIGLILKATGPVV